MISSHDFMEYLSREIVDRYYASMQQLIKLSEEKPSKELLYKITTIYNSVEQECISMSETTFIVASMNNVDYKELRERVLELIQ